MVTSSRWRYVSVSLSELEQAASSTTQDFADPTDLGQITTPILLLQGEHTAAWAAADSVHYLANHLPESELHEVPGAAHSGTLLAPEAVAAERIRFFAHVHDQPQLASPSATNV